MIAFIPSAWLLARGVRIAGGTCCMLVALGSAVRCFTAHNPEATVLIHLGQFLNGLAGPIAMSMGPTLSAAWFPANERVFATSVCSTFNYLGVAFSFLIGPAIVKQPGDRFFDKTRTTQQFMLYMWAEGVYSIACLLCVVLYFPNKPPTAPTVSAQTQRTSFTQGLKVLAKSKAFWIVGGGYGVMTGMYTGWSAYLLPNLESFLPANRAQGESGWLGFYATMIGCVVAIVVSKLSDIIGGHMRIIVLTLCFGATAA